MRIRLGHSGLHFRHRDHGQKTDKEQKKRSENPECADVCPDIHPSRVKHSPGRGKKIAMQSADDNDEALEPHAGVHAHADKINDKNVPPAPPRSEEHTSELQSRELI